MDQKPTAGRRFARGTSLIEIMLVVLIIGIISSLAIPRILLSAARARRAEATSMLDRMRRHFIPLWRNTGAYASVTSDFNPPNLPATAGQPAAWNPNAVGWNDFSSPPDGALRLRYQYTSSGQSLVLHVEGNMQGLDSTYSYTEYYLGDTLLDLTVESPEL